MAITLKKAVPAQAAEDAVDIKDVVNQYERNYIAMGKLALQMKKLQDKMKPLKTEDTRLLEVMVEANSDKGDDEPFEAEGDNMVVEFTKRGSERSIKDIKYIQKKMGNKVFYELAKINIGDVDKYLTEPERNECLEITRTKRGSKVRMK